MDALNIPDKTLKKKEVKKKKLQRDPDENDD